MITGHDALRQDYLDGDVTPSMTLRVASTPFDFVWDTQSVIVDYATEGDDFHCLAGLHFPWGDAAQTDAVFTRIWNERQWGGTNHWHVRVGVLDAFLLAGSVPTLQSRCRPGLYYNAATETYRVFYIADDGMLYWREIVESDFSAEEWETTTESVGGTLRDANNVTLGALAYAIAPVSENECFVIGYSTPLLWVCRFVYNGGSGYWEAGAIEQLALLTDFHWSQVFNFDAEPLGDDRILIVPTSKRQVQAATWHEGIYSNPHWIIASPEIIDEGGQRVWVYSLATIAGRLWGVAAADIDGGNGFYYAAYTRLVSSPDGVTWRDEGAVCIGIRPLKAGLLGEQLIVTSPASYARSQANWRVDASLVGDRTNILSPNRVETQHPGIGTQQARIVTLVQNALVVPGARIEIDLGNGTDTVPLFRGFVDQASKNEGLGHQAWEILARGPLSRLIGETSYAPPSTLVWTQRTNWRTRFMVENQKIVVMGLAAESGDWLPERDRNSDYGALRLRKSAADPAIATAPQPIEAAECYIYARAKTDKAMGVTFWHDDAEKIKEQYWMVHLDADALYIIQMAEGMPIIKASVPLADFSVSYTVGDEVEFQVYVGLDGIQAWASFPGNATDTPAAWAHIEYRNWFPEQEIFRPENRWLAGIEMSVTAEGMVYEFGLCAGEEPTNVRRVLTALAELAGVETAFGSGVTIVTGSGSGSVQHLDAEVAPNGLTSGIWISNYKLTIADTYAVLGQYDSAGTAIWRTCRPYCRSTGSFQSVRVVAGEDCISLYHGERLLTAIHVDMADAIGTIGVHGGATMHIPHLADMNLPGGLAWGYNENAAGILQNLLNRRRVYLLELPTGIVQVADDIEGGSVFPCGNYDYYRRATWTQIGKQDLRETRSIIGVLAADYLVSGAYVINDSGLKVRARTSTDSNPWALSREAARIEAGKQLKDQYRAADTREIHMLPDPGLCIGDIITLSDGWQGIVRQIVFGISLDQALRLEATVIAWRKWTSEQASGVWGTATWGNFSWS